MLYGTKYVRIVGGCESTRLTLLITEVVMNEFDSPNYAEYSYDVKSEGRVRTLRIMAILGYGAFLLLYFLVCYATRMIPVFAIAPIFTWILVFFTWGYVKYDYYFEFKTGMLELGRIVGGKKGRKRQPKLTIHVKEAKFIGPYPEYADKVKEAEIVYDFSSSKESNDRIIILFNKDGKQACAIFEGTAKIANLLTSFCSNTVGLKGKTLHG